MSKFPLGTIVMTTTFEDSLLSELHPVEASAFIATCLRRFTSGDWGEVDDHDKQHNDRALIDGNRLVAVYYTPARLRFYVITEADRSVTTLLLPEDY